jgi:hypothetical protein
MSVTIESAVVIIYLGVTLEDLCGLHVVCTYLYLRFKFLQ